MSLLRAVLHGSFWTTAAIYCSALTSLAVTAALARLLLPGDFGVLAAVVAVTSVFDLLAETGLGSAIVQRTVATREELSSVFWFSLAAAAAIFAALALTAPAWAALFDTPLVADVLPVLGVNVVLYGAMVVPLGLLRRDLRFRIVAVSQMAAVAGAGAVAILLAVLHAGHWALVGQSVAFVAMRAAVLWTASRWTPLPVLRARDVRKALSYSGPIIAHLAVNHWSRNADAVLIARYLGADALGYYNLAQRLVAVPMQLVTGGVRALHPALAHLGTDGERLRRALLQLLRGAALITFPLAGIAAAAAAPLVAVVWGPGWEPAVRVVQALALLVATQPIAGLSGPVLMARNETGLMVRLSLVGAPVVIAAMAIGLRFGVEGVAWGFSLSYALLLVPMATLVTYVRVLQGRAADVLQAVAGPALGGAMTLAAGVAAAWLLPGATPQPARLAVVVAASGAAAAGFVAVAGGDLIRDLFRRGGASEDLAAAPSHERIG